MRSALILGGTGVIGSAAARRLASSGWSVTVVGRDPDRMTPELTELGVTFVACDRSDLGAIRRLSDALGPDLLVDCVCFTAEDANGLLDLAATAGSTVMISSKAVYVDDVGNNVNSLVGPTFPRPITEDQPTMAPGIGDPMIGEGYGSHKAAAELVLLSGDQPVTVIRASKVHGPGGGQHREWVFVKRCLDRRRSLLLAGGGRGVDHPTAAANLAALIETVARQPGRRVLNCADPDAPTVLEISRVIAAHLDHRFDEVLLGNDTDGRLGIHPWMTAHPIILDMSAAKALGYAPVGNHADTVGETVEWMTSQAITMPGEGAHLPGADHEWFAPMFDYQREDAYLAALQP